MKIPHANIRSDLAQIRARIKEGLPDHDILKQAAVVTHFDLFSLADEFEDADSAMLLLMDNAMPLSAPDDAWGLPLDRRQNLLSRFPDRAAVQACLATMPDRPKNPTQKAFELLIHAPELAQDVLESQNADAIAAMLIALSWLARAPQLQQGLPDTGLATQALADARRMAPLRRLVGDSFEGRVDVLDKMRFYLDTPEGDDVLFIHGPGGIGKSTVLAKFALDAVGREDLDAVVYLNLDRPILRPEEPLSLLLDLLSQLSRQFPEASGMLNKVSGTVRDLERRLSYTKSDQTVLESVVIQESDWDWIVSEVAAAISDVPGTRKILVLVDTFEQAQRHGSHVVSEMWRMTNKLMERAPRLRVIAAGRLEEQQYSDNRIPLEAFERSDVRRVLSKAVGDTLPEDLVDDIYRLTDGHPLTVQLAASYVGRVGLEGFNDPIQRERLLSRLREEKRDALLYGRILMQIGDLDVQQIALPALVMRRITPGVIRDVLTEPCGLKLEPGGEEDLFNRMAAEVDLVTLDYSDPEGPALVHRPDVRALMISDLRQDPNSKAAEIDERAIDYFSTLPGEYARAEEIYHRIWRGDYSFQLESRWMPGVEPLLVSALDELQPDQQPWLSKKLGVTPAQHVTASLNLMDWERVTAANARQLLTRGDPAAALDLLSERTERSTDSELVAIEAEAHVALRNHADALAVLDTGIEAARKSVEKHHLVELLLLRCQTLEGQRHFASASKYAAEALELSNSIDDEEYRLRATAALLRLNRKSRATTGPGASELKESVQEIIEQDNRSDTARPLPEVLYENPGLTRQLAAEVGDDNPDLLELSILQTGSLAKPEDDTVGSQFTNAILRLLSNMEAGDFGQIAAKIADNDDGDLIRNLPELLAMARDRRVLDKVKKPLSWLLSADVDRQMGAFPSKSMIKRTTGMKIESD